MAPFRPVTVTVENMPAARRVGVDCSVYRIADSGREQVLGQTSAFAPVSEGRFSGTITVAFNADASMPPGLARSYACFIVVYGVTSDGREFFSSYNVLADAWLAATGQRITVEPTSVGGPLAP